MDGKGAIRLGALLLVVAVAGLVLGFGPARFGDRLSGRVDAPGVVQWGIAQDAVSADERIPDDTFGAWKVDYEIDGRDHTGIILGTYREGQQIIVSAPSDGSIYALLHEGVSAPVKVLSWILTPLSAIATVAGIWYLVVGVRRRDELARAEAREQLARRYPQLFPLPMPQPSPPPAEPEEPRPGDDPPPRHDFFAPYDI